MAITRVSGQHTSGSGSTPVTVTLPNNPTAGNLVVVGFIDLGSGPRTVQDANSNSYTATSKTPFAGTIATINTFYLANAPANASKTITITATGSAFTAYWVQEYAGAATSSVFENDTTSDSSNVTSIVLPSYTSTNDGDLLFASVSAGGAITSTDSPWTVVDAVVPNGNGGEDLIQTSHGAQAVAWTQSPSAAASAMIAAFKVAPAAAATNVAPLQRAPFPSQFPIDRGPFHSTFPGIVEQLVPPQPGPGTAGTETAN